MRPVEPIFVADLFPGLHEQLLSLLRGLREEDWGKPTAAKLWTVKDIAAHLFDGDVRRLSFERDGMAPLPPERPIESYGDLVAFLNGLNADWVKAAKRISPRLLIELMELTGPQVCEAIAALDPFAPAMFSVAWAGEEVSPTWFHVAREYTEKWHHQQQIRDAVGAPGLTGRKWLHPVLDTFLRGLPYTFREAAADEGTVIAVEITGEAGGAWAIQREQGRWSLYAGAASEARTRILLDQDTAWRLMTKGLSREEARPRIRIEGEPGLGEPILGMLSVMA